MRSVSMKIEIGHIESSHYTKMKKMIFLNITTMDFVIK